MYRKRVTRDVKRLDAAGSTLESDWDGEHGLCYLILRPKLAEIFVELVAKPTATAIRAYLRKIDSLAGLLSKYNDPVTTEIIEKKREHLVSLMAGIGMEPSGKQTADRQYLSLAALKDTKN